jgi:hypothetical protein
VIERGKRAKSEVRVICSLSCSGKDFLNQRFKARVAAQRIEQRFDLDECNIVSVPILVSFFEQLQRLVLLAESDMDQSEIVWRNVTLL